jgi:hypothetical protein
LEAIYSLDIGYSIVLQLCDGRAVKIKIGMGANLYWKNIKGY